MPTLYHLALGSNQGNRRRNLLDGLKLLARHGRIPAVSSVFITKPVNMPDPCSNFFNMVCSFESDISPRRLLCLCKAIEVRCGRQYNSHNLPRPLDIDILLAGSQQVCLPDLQIPHSGIAERPFVLLPLLEIDAELQSPDIGVPYRILEKNLSRRGILGRFKLTEHGVANS